MTNIFNVLSIVCPLLLVTTYLLFSKKKAIWKILLIHSILFMLYSLFIINYSTILISHDKSGLGQIGLFVFAIISHASVGFLYSMHITFNQIKSNFQILNEL